jgi:hypothetical protein
MQQYTCISQEELNRLNNMALQLGEAEEEKEQLNVRCQGLELEVYVFTCLGNVLILKLWYSVLLFRIEASYLWLFQADDEGDEIYYSDYYRHLSELYSLFPPQIYT